MQKDAINSKGVLTILLYHGITNVVSVGIENYSGKHLKKSEFLRQMSFLKENCTILSMDDVVRHYNFRETFPENSVAITFDDGFKNNFTVAVPILNDLEIPATFYMATGFINTKKMFWVDILEDCINRCRKHSITINMREKESAFLLTDTQSRINTLEVIKAYCKSTDNEEKEKIVSSVSEATGNQASVESSENYLKMSWDDLLEINCNPLFAIGAHTLSHAILTALPPDTMKQEVSLSIHELENRLQCKIKHFSYPEGQDNHYDNYLIDHLKQSGIVCCPSAVDGVNTIEDDLFHLKRIMPSFMGRPFPFNDFLMSKQEGIYE